MIRRFLLPAMILAQSMVLVAPEIIDLGLNMILDASSDEVHFVRGFLQAPASIDLSNIRWITNEDIVYDFGDDETYTSVDDATDFEDDEIPEDDDNAAPPTEPETSVPVVEPSDVGKDEDNNDIAGEDEDNNGDEMNGEGDKNSGGEVEPSEPTIPAGEGDSTEPLEPPTTESKEIDNEGESTTPVQAETPAGADNEEVVAPKEVQAETPAGADNEEVVAPEEVQAETPAGADNEEVVAPEEVQAETPAGADNEEVVAPEEVQAETPAGADNEEVVAPEEVQAETPAGADNEEVVAPEEVQAETPAGADNEEVVAPEEVQAETPAGADNEEDVAPEEVQAETPAGADNEEVVAPEEDQAEASAGDDKNDGGDEIVEEASENGEEGVDEEQIDAPTATPPADNGGVRLLQNGGTHQILDIVLFLVPRDCKSDNWGNCDWVTLGVGSYDNEMEGGMSYCCSKDTADRGICENDKIGTMMIDHNTFEGDHRTIAVPNKPLTDFDMDEPLFDVEKTGDYVMVIANCDDDGFGIITLGNMEWKSVGGYLPGDMYGLMLYYGAMTAVYLVIALWYYCGMKTFQEGAIPIQKYILGTIVLGFLATAFQGIDLLTWNITGTRNPPVMYTTLVLGTLFQGSLRCLGVMVAMGWGVVRDTLGLALCKIVFLGLLYSGLAVVRDFLKAVASSAQLVSSTEEAELFDLALILSMVIIVVNIMFYCWIISSLRTTTEYLKNMNQTSKLRRHLRLRCLIITSLVIIVTLTVVQALQYLASLNLDNVSLEPFLSEDQVWILHAVGYGNYLFILFGVTILWRPTADAKDYAMAMQLPSHSDDDNDLELSCEVPSANDMDSGHGYKIDDAVAT